MRSTPTSLPDDLSKIQIIYHSGTNVIQLAQYAQMHQWPGHPGIHHIFITRKVTDPKNL